MKKAIVIGTSTGIGKALAYELHAQKYAVGLTGRNLDAMLSIQRELGENVWVEVLDVRNPETAMHSLGRLIERMGGLDIIFLNAGILPLNPNMDWKTEQEGSVVNVIGFQAMANVACHFFDKQGHGHIVGISSIAGLRGTGRSPAYSASKAFVSIYLEGLRQRYIGTKIKITDIRPGLINTPMTERFKRGFLGVSAEHCARDILSAATQKKNVAYVPMRWWWVAQVIKIIPGWIYHRLYRRYA